MLKLIQCEKAATIIWKWNGTYFCIIKIKERVYSCYALDCFLSWISLKSPIKFGKLSFFFMCLLNVFVLQPSLNFDSFHKTSLELKSQATKLTTQLITESTHTCHTHSHSPTGNYYIYFFLHCCCYVEI